MVVKCLFEICLLKPVPSSRVITGKMVQLIHGYGSPANCFHGHRKSAVKQGFQNRLKEVYLSLLATTRASLWYSVFKYQHGHKH